MVTKTRKYVRSNRMDAIQTFNGITTQQSFTTSVEDVVDSKTGISQPQWKARIKSAQSATTAASGERTRVLEFDNLVARIVYGGLDNQPETHYKLNIDGLPGGSQNTRPGYNFDGLTAADNQAKSRGYSALRQQMSHMNSLVTLGELRETVNGIRKPFRAIVTGFERYFSRLQTIKGRVRLRVPNPRKQLKIFLDAASGTWLEVALGLKPLLSDVRGIAETVARYNLNRKIQSVVRGYGVSENLAIGYSEDVSWSMPFVGIPVPLVAHIQLIGKTEVIYRIGLKQDYGADFTSAERARQLSGFTLENFVPAAYEVIPYSFLVDYFTNIGQMVESACTSTAAVAWTNRTERYSRTRRSTIQIGPYSNPAYRDVRLLRPGKLLLSESFFSRTAQGLSVPSIEVSLPGSNLKVANILALFLQKQSKLLQF